MPLLPRRRDQGFSMPEVMVSSILITLVVANSTSLYMRSQGSLRSTSLRDAVNARIAADLEELRSGSWRFGCEDGTEAGTTSTACTGLPADADKPVAYKTGRAPNGTPAPLSDYQQACTNNTLASLMQTKDSRFKSGKQILPLATSTQNAALATSNVSIERTISLDPNDRNKLNISYATPLGSPVRVYMNSTIVPQALGWCS